MIALRFAHTERHSLPNLLVPIDLRDGAPTGPSLFALSEGRRIAHQAGATVYAVVMSDHDLAPEEASRLGRAGADKVILCEGEGLAAPPLQATHGPALLAAVERIPPLMVLFPAGGAGAELGPSLAARLGAAFAPAADLEVMESRGPLPDGIGRVFVRRWWWDRASYRRLDPVEIERPLVALLGSGRAPDELGTDDIDVEVIACKRPVQVGVKELASDADDAAEVPLSRVLVVVDPALGPAALARLAAGAPRGVVVVDRAEAATAIAASAPDILIGVGHADLPAVGTPRARVGVILFDDAPLPPRARADVLWRAAGEAGELFWDELARALAGLIGSGAQGADQPAREPPP